MTKICLAMVCACSFFFVQGVSLANPTCVMLKFSDDTRFKQIDTAGTLSDLIMEKLVSSGKFNFKETKIINSDLEQILYDENAANIDSLQGALASGNYNDLFESGIFAEKRAQTIYSAQLGQFVSPAVVKSIGNQHSAEYIMHGTIVNLGRGVTHEGNPVMQANAIASMFGHSIIGMLGPLGGLFYSADVEKAALGVQCDLKVIKADTGEVVWKKLVTGVDTNAKVSSGNISIGDSKANSEMYYKAMENAAKKIADDLVSDESLGKLLNKQ